MGAEEKSSRRTGQGGMRRWGQSEHLGYRSSSTCWVQNFSSINSKQMKDKYISYDNILMEFWIAGLHEEILCKFHWGWNPAWTWKHKKSLWSPKGSDFRIQSGPHHPLRSCSLAVHYIMRAQSLSFHKGGSNVDEWPMKHLKGTEQLGINQGNHKQGSLWLEVGILH